MASKRTGVPVPKSKADFDRMVASKKAYVTEVTTGPKKGGRRTKGGAKKK